MASEPPPSTTQRWYAKKKAATKTNAPPAFQAEFARALFLKRLVAAIKDLFHQINLDCSSSGIFIQALDDSHVALLELKLNSTGFANFRCDCSLRLGITVDNLEKILKIADNNDSVIMTVKKTLAAISYFFTERRRK